MGLEIHWGLPAQQHHIVYSSDQLMVLKPAGLATGKADIHAELWRKTHPVWTGKLSVRRRKRARSAKRKGFLEKRRYKPYPSSHKMDNTTPALFPPQPASSIVSFTPHHVRRQLRKLHSCSAKNLCPPALWSASPCLQHEPESCSCGTRLRPQGDPRGSKDYKPLAQAHGQSTRGSPPVPPTSPG
ncbi:unnamed protein product [Pleuronectes platessa]|uniref:Uncharacterized protein n=1 Tax=Pleuronectes platessa TaxID=8262 RepID=A0A9N7UF24_PLEPL|nr:unnamed protein product [Pleuronectes platessa]